MVSAFQNEKIYEFGDFRLIPGEGLLLRYGEPVALQPKAFAVLALLVEHHGHLVTKSEIIDSIWENSFIEEGAISKSVWFVRNALGDTSKEKFVQTVPRRGYRFVAPVKTINDPAAAYSKPEFVSTGYRLPLEHKNDDLDAKFISSGEHQDATGKEHEVPEEIAKPSENDAEPQARSEAVAEMAPNRRLYDGRGVFAVSALIVLIVAGLAAVVNLYAFLTSMPSEMNASERAVGVPTRLFWELSEEEKREFIKDQATYIQQLIGDHSVYFDDESLDAIQRQVEWYVDRRDSLSQEPFSEGLRVAFGRATQFAPLISAQFEKTRVPTTIGIYQAMIESEYRDCLMSKTGPVGLFQFTEKTSIKYGMQPQDRCNIDQQARAAAQYMSDLLSDFGEPQSSWTLALLSFDQGGERTRQQLRELRRAGVTERTYWAIVNNPNRVSYGIDPEIRIYVPRFFAAAIIGETPEIFGLVNPPLTTIR